MEDRLEAMGIKVSVEAVQRPWHPMEWRFEDEVKGTEIELLYENYHGELILQHVTVTSIHQYDATPRMKCQCHEKKCEKTLRIDKMSHITDIGTGQTFETWQDWLRSLDLPMEPRDSN